jgi:hypothetical protein
MAQGSSFPPERVFFRTLRPTLPNARTRVKISVAYGSARLGREADEASNAPRSRSRIKLPK